MIGAIIGDIAGSHFEWDNHRNKEFELLNTACFPTDDSFMTLAIAKALTRTAPSYEGLARAAVEAMQELGRKYPDGGYGGRFMLWLQEEDPQPYHSWGNGSAMRVSACAYAADSYTQAVRLAHNVTAVTHDHPEGIKGAEAVAVAIYLARTGSHIDDIRTHIRSHYYPISFTLSEIRNSYAFDVSCQGSVPQALEAFFESTDFEDAIRNAVSIGGDSDTIAAIAGSVAGAYYGVPRSLYNHALRFLDKTLESILHDFETCFPDSKKLI